MKKVLFGLLLVASVAPQVAQAQFDSSSDRYSGREEKSGSGSIRANGKDLRLERVFVRLDRNGEAYIRMYPQAFARTYSGRYSREGNRRIRVDLYEGIEHAVGTIEFSESNRGELTFSRIELRGETRNGDRQTVSFRPSSPNRPGSDRETSVEDWNRRWGSGNGGWGGSGGSNNGGGWGGSGGSGGNWGGGNVDASTAGRGNIDWKGRDYRISRADVTYRDGRATIRLETSRGRVEIRTDGGRMNGLNFSGGIDRFANQSGDGNVSFRLSSNRKEVESINFTGRSDGSNFRGNFRRN